jgi:hypothetical protein
MKNIGRMLSKTTEFDIERKYWLRLIIKRRNMHLGKDKNSVMQAALEK